MQDCVDQLSQRSQPPITRQYFLNFMNPRLQVLSFFVYECQEFSVFRVSLANKSLNLFKIEVSEDTPPSWFLFSRSFTKRIAFRLQQSQYMID